MAELIKVKGLKGKQNKKKWIKNVDVSGLLQQIEQQHTQKVREQFASPLQVEEQGDRVRKPLDPNRFKSKGVPLPKPKYDNKIKKQSILDEPVEDAWGAQTEVLSKYKKPEIPSVIAPTSGHSYNPSQQSLVKVVDKIIDYEASKPKKTKPIKKTNFKQQQIRHRNKNLRAQQLQIRERKSARQLLHEIHSSQKIAKQLQQKQKQIQRKVQQKQEKKQKWQAQAKTGRVRYGKNIGKLQYKYREDLPKVEQIGKKLSHVGGSEDLVRDRFDTVYRRGIFEPRSIKVHANKTKRIKSKTKYRDEEEKDKKDGLNFIQ